MKRIKVFLATLVIVLGLVPAVPVGAAPVDVFHDACTTGGAGGSSACSNNGSDPISGSNGILSKVTTIISILAGIASVILIIVSGFMYVTSNGDAGKLSTAKTTIIYAIVGLVIVVMAQAIVLFVLNRL